PGVVAPAFRRIARAQGPLRRRQGRRGAGPEGLWQRLNDGDLTPAPPPRRPDGLIAIGESASGSDAPQPPAETLAWLPAWLRRIPWADPVPYPVREPVDTAALAGTVLERVQPALTIPLRVGAVIMLIPSLPTIHWDLESLDEVMAHPEFPQPMYEPLRDLSQD